MSNRKAVILAAGVGSRLGDITREVPKPLIEVGGRVVLDRHLAACAAAGVREVFINTHHLAEKIRGFAGDGSRYGLAVSYSYESELLGTSGALNNFRDNLKDSPFAIIYGDNLIEYDLAGLFQRQEESAACMTIAVHFREDVSMSGMVVLDENGFITRFVEKPPPEDRGSNLVNAGIYICSPRVLSFVPEGFSDFGKNIIPSLIAAGEPLASHLLEKELLAIDTPELLVRARARYSA